MVDDRTIPFNETIDVQAIKRDPTGNWIIWSRDPERKFYLPNTKILNFLNVIPFYSYN